MQPTELKYRPDIDGLRALAVLLVVAFHLEIPRITGGFVGVDIFFVISGYLITGIIQKEIDETRFSISGFYERRARRILPALFALLLVCTVLSLHYLLPGELISYGKSMLGATFSYSNFYFWSTADYFDAPAHTKPLLHTWSLAVEEQFYLVLPPLLLLLARGSVFLRKIILGALLVISLALSTYLASTAPNSAFYLPYSRTWELLAGSMLALNVFPSINKKWMREGAATVGVIAILVATVTYTSHTPFPGLAALLPCAGAALIMASGRYGLPWSGKLLSWRPVVFVGRISYSVYLWHWPLIVFSKMGFLPWIPRRFWPYTVSVGLISLLIGYLSWRFVEQPLRVGRIAKLSRQRVFTLTGLAMACSAAAAITFLTLNGLDSRFPASAVKVADFMNTRQEMRIGTCFITTKYKFDQFRSDLCMRVDPSKKNYLLLGDSHSAALWYGLQELMPTANILQASVSGCNPVISTTANTTCGEMMRYVFEDYLPSHNVQAVFITARWSNVKEFNKISPTVDWCIRHKLAVYILGPVLEYDSPLPKLLAYSIAFNSPNLPAEHMIKRFLEMDATMKHLAEDTWNVHYVSIIDVVCPAGKCTRVTDGINSVPLMADDNHLSNAGSALVVRKLVLAGELPT